MQYSVPQFVDVEDKVIGPLSIRQFLWILAGAGICLVLWLVLPMILAIILGIPILLLGGAFAFFKVNGVAFHIYVANLIGFVAKPKTRVWKREIEMSKNIIQPKTKKEKQKLHKVELSDVNLDQLSFILDHELAAQSKTKPITNAIEQGQAPQPQVIFASQQSQSVYQGESEGQSIPQAEPAQPTPQAAQQQAPQEPPKPQVVTSIKPFRKE